MNWEEAIARASQTRRMRWDDAVSGICWLMLIDFLVAGALFLITHIAVIFILGMFMALAMMFLLVIGDEIWG